MKLITLSDEQNKPSETQFATRRKVCPCYELGV